LNCDHRRRQVRDEKVPFVTVIVNLSRRVWGSEAPSPCFLRRSSREFTRPTQDKIEETALDRDFRFVATRQSHCQRPATDANKFNAFENAVRQSPNVFRQLEPAQNCPTRRV
jgi:hypothetical protein